MFTDRKRISLVLAFLAAVLLLAAFLQRPPSAPGGAEPGAAVSAAYRLLESRMEQYMDDACRAGNDSGLHRLLLHRGIRNDGISLFIFRGGQLRYWSDNETDISTIDITTVPQHRLLALKNGWYVCSRKQAGDLLVAGLLLVKKNYAYQNQFLVNDFNPALHVPPGTSLAEGNVTGSVAVTRSDGSAVAYLQPSSGPAAPGTWPATLQAVAIFLLGCAVWLHQQRLLSGSPATAAATVLALVAVRFVMIRQHWPGALYETPFFSPSLYASSFWFNSPGDLLLNALLFLFLARGLARRPRAVQAPSFPRRVAWLFVFLALSVALNSLVSGLVVNSRIPFDISNLYELNYATLSGVLIIGLLLFAFSYAARAIAGRLPQEAAGTRGTAAAFMMASVVAAACVLLLPRITTITLRYGWTDILFASVLFAFHTMRRRGTSLNFLMLHILLFALYSAGIIQVYNQRKELESRRLLATRLEANQDNIAEYLFDDVEQKISADPALKVFFASGNQEAVVRRVSRLYLGGYWTRYETAISCIRADGMPFDSLTGWSFDKALQFIKDHGEATTNNYLYSVSHESGRLSYVSMVPIVQADTLEGHLLIRLDEKLLQAPEGLPELFISSKVAARMQTGNYSFARYAMGKLVYQQGPHAYYTSATAFSALPPSGESVVVRDREYNHLISGTGPGNYLVISRKNESPLIFFTVFSYLAALFSLAVFVIHAVAVLARRRFRPQLSFKRRIQSSVLALVIFSFLLIGGETISFLIHRYDESQSEQVRTRVSALSLALESLPGREFTESGPDDDTRIALIQAAAALNADFNLFSLGGGLLFSSQPKIFEQGIVSPLMDPEALYELRVRGRSTYVHPENIGGLNFTAAYEPLRDNHGNVTAYLNLPYFEKQNERNREISSFLSTLINTYVLLLILSVFLTLLIASRITAPLRLIQEKLSTIRLGTHSEHISWSGHDEIGQLVAEYNRTVDELAVSADKLARSERETAWREMARQVAHEIKNPLTPMKLSIQHLQKAWREQDPNREALLERISATLVEQIDSLSGIATAFADFARMPADRKDAVSLNEVVTHVADLFRDTGGFELSADLPGNDCVVMADRDQLMRVVSNLMNNAVQALSPDRPGKIAIRLLDEPESYQLEIEDNGKGISNELISKIFTPNFTTKGSGMGLGLAMVRKIVENYGGQIRFTTKENSGSTFYVSFPKSSP
jgi:two-component system nitrogen regulation sensor histidine kinase NtrY